MKRMKVFKIALSLCCLLSFFGIHAQTNSGRIVYERKINLHKKYKDNEGEYMAKLLEENKYRIEQFELIFNDSLSIFQVLNEKTTDPLAWMTKRNTTLQNLKDSSKLVVCDISGQVNFVNCTPRIRTWKITNDERIIAGYKCRKAIWEGEGEVKIYAWYSIEVIAPVGPEGFYGLPGAILGLASEDGGIVYFATLFEPIVPNEAVFHLNSKKKSTYFFEDFKEVMTNKFSESESDKEYLIDFFNWF
jgi:GLPGLI family protein